MAEKTIPKRNLVDITLEEAIKVIQLGEGYSKSMNYQLRRKTNPFGEKFAQLYYVYDNEESIAANFSDTKDAVKLCDGNEYYRTYYRIIKFLEERGFDLESNNSRR